MMNAFALTSPAFSEGGFIPRVYTGEGRDISPALSWTAPPETTVSLVLIVDDPDAPGKTWDHWILFNLPANTRELPENIAPQATLGFGERHGKNSWGKLGYGGPMPPSGVHRYFFKLYALDVVLNLAPGVTKPEVEKAMEGHILAQCQLMGKYTRG